MTLCFPISGCVLVPVTTAVVAGWAGWVTAIPAGVRTNAKD